MNVSPEEYGRVVCAVLFYNNCIYMGREGHHVIFPMEEIGVLRSAKQGFVTENGYFVALYIAEYFDQIDNKYNPKDRLVSEDLKKEDIKILRYIKDYNYKEKR